MMRKLFIILSILVLFSLTFISASELRVTEEHPFLINGEWISASELQVGDELTLVNGSKVKITKLTDIETEEPFLVYNLEAGEYHNFVVGEEGVVVHNSNFIPSGVIQKEGVGNKFFECKQCSRANLCPFNNLNDGRCGGLPAFLGKRVSVGTKVKVFSRTSGKDLEAIVADISNEGKVQVRYSFNKLGSFTVGEKVVVSRSEPGMWTTAEILSVDSSANRAVVRVPLYDASHKILRDELGNIKYSTKEVGLAGVFKRDGNFRYKWIDASEIKTSPVRTVRDQIGGAISEKELKKISATEYDSIVRPEYRIANARKDLMTTIVEGGSVTKIAIREGETATWVLTAEGKLRFANKFSVQNEQGIKHIQLSLGEEVIYAGEMKRVGGRLKVDLSSGTFSSYGLNPQFSVKDMNNKMNLESFMKQLLPDETIEIVEFRPWN